MPKNEFIKDLIQKSPVRKTIDMVGDRWTLLVLLGAFYGFSRFDDWLNRHQMSSSVLSNRLKRLQKYQILDKAQIGNSRITSYSLTESGKELLPWAVAVWNWENSWMYQGDGHPVSIMHTQCGNRILPSFLCEHCNYPVRWGDISVSRGPGYFNARISKQRSSRRSIVSTEHGDGSQNFGRIADILGDSWSYLVISASFYGVRRFDDFLVELDIAPNTLSDRLKRLVDHGLLARSCYQTKPARWEYIQTEKTQDFVFVPLMLGLWADKWLEAPRGGPSLIRTHRVCGKTVRVKLVCGTCDQALEFDNTRFQEEIQHQGDH